MERLLPVKFDTEYVRETRLVRSRWGGWTPGTVIEVSMAASSGYAKWVTARVERWNGKALFVTMIDPGRTSRAKAPLGPEPTW